MAKVLDDVLEEVDANSLDDLDPVVENQMMEDVVDDLPEKYRNKSVKDMIAMHQEAEKFIGKQGGEVGELRKVVDDFIKAQSSNNLKTEEVDSFDDENAFFSDPKFAVNKAIDNHPAIREAQQANLMSKQANIQNKLAKEFPDYKETVNSSAFSEWIKGSKVRTELFDRAHNSFDYDSAEELLSNWNERKGINQRAVEISKLDRDLQLKAADVGNSSSQESTSKKKYRRSDIINLIRTNPDAYEARSAEIMLAYQEGRVY
jgi:hypothetical protein